MTEVKTAIAKHWEKTFLMSADDRMALDMKQLATEYCTFSKKLEVRFFSIV